MVILRSQGRHGQEGKTLPVSQGTAVPRSRRRLPGPPQNSRIILDSLTWNWMAWTLARPLSSQKQGVNSSSASMVIHAMCPSACASCGSAHTLKLQAARDPRVGPDGQPREAQAAAIPRVRDAAQEEPGGSDRDPMMTTQVHQVCWEFHRCLHPQGVQKVGGYPFYNVQIAVCSGIVSGWGWV